MKLLYFSALDEVDKKKCGILSKIKGQIRAFTKMGYNVSFGHFHGKATFVIESENTESVCIPSKGKYTRDRLGSIYDSVFEYIKDNEINIVYIRYTSLSCKAIDFYKQGAKLGSARAMNNLGSAYNCGLGVQKNPCEAVVWFEKAASLNYELGIKNLADCYYDGEGVSRDYSKALVLYKKAAELGNSGAMNRIGFCYDQGFGVEKDLREAFVWFKKSADLGNSAAMGNVGLCYEYGDGVEVNYKKAAEWYEKAIAAGYEKAKKSLERVKKLM